MIITTLLNSSLPALAGTLAQASTPSAPGREGAPDRSLLDYILQGREVGLIIIALSVVSLGLIIAQYVLTRVQRLAPQAHTDELAEKLNRGDVSAAIAYCEDPEVDSMLTRTVGAALTRAQRSPFGVLELADAVEESGREQVARLSRGIDGVALIATIAPMLGLLGTVIGILGAFDTLSLTQGPPQPADMAGDISAALVTTVLGLIVAIPSTAAHTFLRNRLESAAHAVGETIEQLVAPLQTSGAAQQAPRHGGARPQTPAAKPEPGPAQAAPQAQRQPQQPPTTQQQSQPSRRAAGGTA